MLTNICKANAYWGKHRPINKTTRQVTATPDERPGVGHAARCKLRFICSCRIPVRLLFFYQSNNILPISYCYQQYLNELHHSVFGYDLDV